MADLKISALTSATTPLAGTEVLPIVQSSTTKQVSVANLTAGRAISSSSVTTTAGTSVFGTGASTLLATFGDNLTVGTTILQVKRNAATTDKPIIQGIIAGVGASNIILQKDGGDVEIGAGNVVISTSGKGIDFSATSGSGTSELLADYEEGTWTPNQGGGLTVVGAFSSAGTYTKVGRLVTVNFSFSGATSVSVAAGGSMCTNLPFTTAVTAGGVLVRAGLASGGTFAIEGGTTNAWATSTIAATGTLFCSITYSV